MSASKVLKRYIEAIEKKDAGAFADLFTEDGVIIDPFFPEPTTGREAIVGLIEGVTSAFPDMKWSQVGDVLEDGDRAAFVIGVKGTNDGPLPMPGGEMPATGRKMAYDAAVFWTFDADGRIAEERSYFDAAGVATQLGLAG